MRSKSSISTRLDRRVARFAAPPMAEPRATLGGLRYAVYDPKDPRKAELMRDPVLGEIILGEGRTITLALAAALAPSGSIVWDRQQKRVVYIVP
jgi:hypothetical protein